MANGQKCETSSLEDLKDQGLPWEEFHDMEETIFTPSFARDLSVAPVFFLLPFPIMFLFGVSFRLHLCGSAGILSFNLCKVLNKL